MGDGAIYKGEETYGRHMLYFMYFILMGVCGFEDRDHIYNVILQREDACGTLGDLRYGDTDLGVGSKLLVF